VAGIEFIGSIGAFLDSFSQLTVHGITLVESLILLMLFLLAVSGMLMPDQRVRAEQVIGHTLLQSILSKASGERNHAFSLPEFC
jgi:hypothetical protein